ncbi:hypothetical protein B0H16DRAFT_1698555 [Mycena metata]|uniref:Uncharacterized protein n=1 Tax=Mycena metata TaxID=1033252 RepID=A0AAD7MNE1_9AGAR|nr:hypothetical protein B0H16DRAFT_1698555 [Mycena metata]
MINVVSALLQRVSEMDGTGDFAVFSTWLSPLLSKKVQQGTFYGTIKGHIDDAGEREMLLAKARWLFPLYWAAARHWLLGWVDLTAREIHIFDSMPELQSYMWAELDGMLRVRRDTLDLIYENLGLLAPKPIAPTKVTAERTPDAEDPMGSTATQVAEDVAMTSVEAAPNAENPVVSTATSVAEEGLPLISDFGAINSIDVSDTPIASSSKRKLEDSHSQDSKPSKPVKIPKTAKGKSKTKDQRKEILESDPDTSVVEPHRVFCTKCSAYVKLDKKREFKLENWIQHQERCPGITGQVVVRVAVKKKHVAAGTTTKSEKVSQIDSKYALSRIARAVGAQKDDTNPEKMSLQEAANLTRVLQDQNATIQESKPVKYREIRWKGFAGVVQRLVNADVLPNIIAKNVHQLNPLSVGHMTIMWNGTRFYIGQILDVYKKGANSRHGSIPSPISISGRSFISLRAYLPLGTGGIPDVDEDLEDSGECEVAPLFSCHHKNLPLRIHTHAKVDHLLFNLGPDIFEKAGPGVRHRSLKDHAARCWISLTQPAVSTEVKSLQ